jgi:GGDEF domain-containing protein
MPGESFFEEGTKLLTPDAFQFVLDAELQRSMRSQDYLTLVVVDARREWEGITVTADDGTVREVAQVIGKEVRDADLLGLAEAGTLALALLDADFKHSRQVIDRIITRLEHYTFANALRIAIGAACYPTHAVDAESLTREARARPIVAWSGGTIQGDLN